MPRALGHEVPIKAVVIPKQRNSVFAFILNNVNSYHKMECNSFSRLRHELGSQRSVVETVNYRGDFEKHSEKKKKVELTSTEP